jgi:hypothetical protein
MIQLVFVSTRADETMRQYGNMFYYLCWRELQEHLDRLQNDPR